MRSILGFGSTMLDGVNDQMVHNAAFGDFFNLQRDTPFTIMGWFKLITFNTDDRNHIFSRSETTIADIVLRGYGMRVFDNGRLRFDFHRVNGTDGYGIQTNQGVIGLDQWFHVAVTYDGLNATGSCNMYIDGVDQGGFNPQVFAVDGISYTNLNYRMGAQNNFGDDTAGQHGFTNVKYFSWKMLPYDLSEREVNEYRDSEWSESYQLRNERGAAMSCQHWFFIFGFVPFWSSYPEGGLDHNGEGPGMQLVGSAFNTASGGKDAPFSAQ